MSFWQWAFGRGVLDLVSFWLWAFGFGGLLVVGFWWWAFGGEHIFGGQIALLPISSILNGKLSSKIYFLYIYFGKFLHFTIYFEKLI